MLLLLGHPELESKGTAENERLLPPGAYITSGRTPVRIEGENFQEKHGAEVRARRRWRT